MTVCAISMVKDEADVIEGTLRHLSDEAIDWIFVADNGSTDGTRDILADLSRDLRLTVLDDPDPAYYQSKKMSELAGLAADRGATWIVPFDADEIWVSRHNQIGVDLHACPADMMHARLFNHFPSAVDPEADTPFESIVWRQREPAPLPKVAFRWRDGALIEQGNHGVQGVGDVAATGLEIHHFPYRSAEQFIRKARNGAAAYRATDLPADVGAHWRGYGDILDRFGEDALESVFREYFWALSPADEGWVLDPAPFMRWR